VVEAVRSKFDVCRRDGFEAHFFRKELVDKTVHVLVCTTLQKGEWGIGMSWLLSI
jgi:hypothetical protein